MRRPHVLLALLVLAACARPRAPYRVPAADPSTRRHLTTGDVVGGAGRYGALAWLGIPYAQPPVGDLRWRAPEPAAPWQGTREALTFGAACPQYGSRFGGAPGVRPGAIGGDEDCLTLNVWTPASAGPGMRLPVFVWIHGGGNTIGHAGFFDGGNLAASENLIVVAVQYRLGPLGWFRHPALRAQARDPEEASGNFALLDLVAALRWVHDNAGAFGGDPANVTIAGESAGGTNVYALLLSPSAAGLFHRAVVESGGLVFDEPAAADGLATDAAASTQPPREIAARLFQRAGRAHDRADALAQLDALPADQVATWLRGVSARDLLAAYEPQPSGMITMPRVVRDGTVLADADPVATLAREDGWNHVPVLVGTNRDENKLFMFADRALVHYALWVVPRMVDERGYVINAEYLARTWKAVGADEPAVAMTRTNPAVFVYRFDWREEPRVLGADLGTMLGAAHGFEIPFVFGHFDLGPEAAQLFTSANEPGRRTLSHAVMRYWAQFARAGAPGRGRDGDLPLWEPWDAGRYLVLDTDAGGGIRMATGPETRERVVADVAADPRLSTVVARCRVLRALAEWGRGLSREQYAARADCAPFPYDAFPWAGRS